MLNTGDAVHAGALKAVHASAVSTIAFYGGPDVLI